MTRAVGPRLRLTEGNAITIVLTLLLVSLVLEKCAPDIEITKHPGYIGSLLHCSCNEVQEYG